jgi:hypothetical protein
VNGAALVREALQALMADGGYPTEAQLRARPDVKAILDADDDVRRDCVLQLTVAAMSQVNLARGTRAWQLLGIVGRRKLPLSAGDVRELLEIVRAGARKEHGTRRASLSLRPLAQRVEDSAATWSPNERAELTALVEAVADAVDDQDLGGRLRLLLRAEGELPLDLISDLDDPGRRLAAALVGSGVDHAVLGELIVHLAALPESGKPSKRWIAGAEELRGRLEDPVGLVATLLAELLAADDLVVEHEHAGDSYTTTHFFHYGTGNESFALAIVKLAALTEAPELLEPLRRLAVKCVIVIGGQFGNPRSLKLANAAAQAIADIGVPASITELLALERAIRHGTLLKQIRKAVDSLAEAQGMTREELLERAVETHDLEADGTRDVALARGAARIRVQPRGAALAYVAPDGRERSSFPAAVKDSDGETIAALRSELKAIRKTVAGERHRLDAALALDRRLTAEDWRAYYVEHPVTGRLTRELIWRFEDGLAGIPVDETTLLTADGASEPLPDGEVRLWHPIGADAGEVRAWRQRLLDDERAQPVKQAFRETYALTPAEERTRVYSNRFAGHVFGQVQARALMKGRGWKPVALAWWDDGIDHGVARRAYEPFGIRAEFFYDPIHDMEPAGDLFPYCTSDQVRFVEELSDEPMELADVPVLVFTEAMRDVDLFVGVTSIGMDPEWLDRGEGRRFETYWRQFSFGELSEAAKVRRDVVEQLIPRLAIADRCTLDARHLLVRGDLHTYRIHLGSGNVLMDPDDRYLCIVAARDGRASKLFLPFDDDPVLSVILSKAFMLADDTAITDKTILQQIRGR